uniref:Cephalotocin n=1 Tax=Octopus vulgaris TaxID=6645 RepID=OXYT_OCTVU|nr:RecName: Full=Cephalotocin [Octopus vulgaris]
CYFRNCPIG